MTYVYVLTNQAPDYSAPAGSPRSVHATLNGAKEAFADGKYMDSWHEYKEGERWAGPDGFGAIIKFEVKS